MLENIFGVADLSDSGLGTPRGAAWVVEVARLLDSRVDLLGESCTFRSSAPVGNPSILRSHLAITADAELHNRADLLGRLASFGSIPTSSDASLILSAYEKWGEACPEFLLGDFSFAIWDARLTRLFCCRDHMGTRPFLYWASGSRFAFSSDFSSLCRLPGVGREFNPSKLLAFAIPGAAGELHEETLYRGILSLPAGHSLTFSREGLKKRRYWEPTVLPNLLPSKEEEVFDALRELLFQAVECRLSGKTTVVCGLSGGLDSSAIVSVAAKCLERSNRSVRALAAVLPEASKPEFADEREFIDEFRASPNVMIEYVVPEAAGPFDLIVDPSRFQNALVSGPKDYLNRLIEDRAMALGADVIMNGFWGEAGATTYGNGYYLELAARLRWPALARELLGLRATSHISPVRALGRELRDFIWPSRQFKSQVLLAPDFLMNADLIQTDPVGGKRTPGARKLYWPPDHRRNQDNAIRARMRRHAFGRASAAPYAFPFLDKRVLEFCLAAPGHTKVRDGHQRYMTRRALDGILPKKIQWRTTKCAFAPDYLKRYTAQLGTAREFVAAIRRNDPVRSIVDVERLQYLLGHPETPASRAAAFGATPRSIYLICFLRQFGEFRQ